MKLIGEVDIGPIPATIHPITWVDVVDFWVSRFLLTLLTDIFMVKRELDIGFTPSTLPPITQAGVIYFRVALLLYIMLEKVFSVMIGLI